MSAPMLQKMHMNGYDIVQVNSGPWRVCTRKDRLASFESREQALAYAATLPMYRARNAAVSNHD